MVSDARTLIDESADVLETVVAQVLVHQQDDALAVQRRRLAQATQVLVQDLAVSRATQLHLRLVQLMTQAQNQCTDRHVAIIQYA